MRLGIVCSRNLIILFYCESGWYTTVFLGLRIDPWVAQISLLVSWKVGSLVTRLKFLSFYRHDFVVQVKRILRRDVQTVTWFTSLGHREDHYAGRVTHVNVPEEINKLPVFASSDNIVLDVNCTNLFVRNIS